MPGARRRAPEILLDSGARASDTFTSPLTDSLQKEQTRVRRRVTVVKGVGRQGLVRSALLVVTLLFVAQSGAAQSGNTGPSTQAWGALNASFELSEKTRITAILEKHNGEEGAYGQEKIGAVFSYRKKRFGQHLRGDVDKENEYNLILGAGYEFIRTNQNASSKYEHRLLLQATPKYVFALGFLAQDRNRVEFRWNAGTYNFRYRNRLTIDRPFKIGKVRLSPYAAGELFWDRNHHSWNETQYAFGVQWPYKKIFMLNTYFLHQNCSTCSSNPLNVAGLTANLYFDWPMKR